MHKLIMTLLAVIAFVPQTFALNMDEAVQTALENNYEVLYNKHLELSSKYNAEVAKTPYLPQLDTGYTFTDSSEKAYGNSAEDQYSRFDLTVGYNLFNGFSDKYDLKAAKLSYKAQKHNTNAVKQDIALSVKKAYIDVLAAMDGVIVAENAYKLLENQLKDIKLSYEVGYVAKNEVLKVEAELASSVQSVLSAKSDVKLAVFALEKLMNKQIAESENFAQINDYSDSMGDFEVLKADMMKNRSEIKYLKSLIEAKGFNIKSTKGGYYPKVNLGASYYSYGEDFSPSNRDYAYDDETVLSVKVDMNLFDGFSKMNTTRSLSAEKMSMMHNLSNVKSEMTLQLKNALENFDLANASLTAAEKELTSAKENYRITQNQFKQKVATNTDLMDARVMLTRAENTYNNAKFNIHRAVADVERITEK